MKTDPRRIESAKAWKARNPGWWPQEYKRQRLSLHRRAYQVHRNLRRRAAIINVPFSLTYEWVRERLERGVCEITGVKFDLSPNEKKHARRANSPSVDQKLAGVGYTPENCRMICLALNTAFGMWGEEAFKPLAELWLRGRMI